MTRKQNTSIPKTRVQLYKKRILGFLNTFKQKKKGVGGAGVILFFIIIGLNAPLLAPHDPWKITSNPYSSPSPDNLLGTNDVGQDILSELVYGTRISLTIGILAATLLTFIGTVIGLFAGYFGGWVDAMLMGLTDVVLIIPSLPLMLIFAAYLGPGLWNIIFVISILGWGGTARIVRSQVLSIKERTFVEAEKAIGAGCLSIMFRTILPNVFPLVIVNVILRTVGAIIAESSLSFLGLGDPVQKSWGMMLHYVMERGGFTVGAWWWVVPPGLCILLTATSFSFVGYALEEVINPRLREMP